MRSFIYKQSIEKQTYSSSEKYEFQLFYRHTYCVCKFSLSLSHGVELRLAPGYTETKAAPRALQPSGNGSARGRVKAQMRLERFEMCDGSLFRIGKLASETVAKAGLVMGPDAKRTHGKA